MIIFKILKILTIQTSPANIALSSTVGLFLGLLPYFSFLPWLALVTLFIIRFNAASLALFWLLGELLLLLTQNTLSQLGEFILLLPIFEDVWQTLYNNAFWKLSQFNHTLVMGSLIATALGFIPTYLALFIAFKKYQTSGGAWFIRKLSNIVVLRSFLQTKNTTKPKSFIKLWFNWKGIIAILTLSTIVITAGIFVQLYSNKSFLTQQLTKAWGAPVTIGSFQLTLSPLGFSIENLKVQGLQNEEVTAISIKNAQLTIDLYQAVSKKLVFSNITFDSADINFEQLKNNQKSTSNKDEIAKKDSSIDIPELPSAQEIIAKEKLTTIEYSKQLTDRNKVAKDNFQKVKQSVPTEKKFQQFKSQLTKLKKIDITNLANIKKNAKKAVTLKEDIAKQLKLLSQANSTIQADIDDIISIMKKLPEAPDTDWNMINKKYELSLDNSSNLMDLLLGKTTSKWTSLALDFYIKSQPLINEAKKYISSKKKVPEVIYVGKYINYQENDPQPTFNIKKLNIVASNNDWKINLNNINLEQFESQKATIGYVKVKDNSNLFSTYNLLFDHTTKKDINKISHASNNVPITNKALLDKESLKLIIAKAKQDTVLLFNLSNGNKIKGHWQTKYKGVNWDLEEMNKSKGNQLRPGLFNKIKDFTNKVSIDGTLQSPSVRINSNLDERLYSVMADSMRQSFNRTRREVKKILTDKASESISQGQSTLITFKNQQKIIKKQTKRWKKELLKKL